MEIGAIASALHSSSKTTGEAMSQLTAVQYGDTLVVDSRLISVELEIKHSSFLKTVDEYQPLIEQGFWGFTI